jgi:MFS family permease
MAGGVRYLPVWWFSHSARLHRRYCLTRCRSSRASGGGIGAAFVMPATLSLLTVAYPKEDRMKAVGIWAGTAGSGGVLGMLGSGLLLRFWDWHAIFWSLGIAGLVIFALGCTVSSSRETDAPRVDWLGAVLIGAAVAITVFAILEAPDRGWTDSLVWGGLVAGAVIAVVFGVVEFRRRPLLDVRLQYVQQIMGYSPLASIFVRPVHSAAGHFLSAVVLVCTETGPATCAVHRHAVDGGWFRGPVPTEPAHLVLRIYLADIDTCHGHRNMHGADDFGDHGRFPTKSKVLPPR